MQQGRDGAAYPSLLFNCLQLVAAAAGVHSRYALHSCLQHHTWFSDVSPLKTSTTAVHGPKSIKHKVAAAAAAAAADPTSAQETLPV